MAKMIHSVDLAQQVGRLLEEKARLTAELTQVEQTLGQVGAILKSGPNGVRLGRKPGRPAGITAAPAAPAVTAVTDGRKRKRHRKHFDVTAEDFVLGYVKSHKNPTTKDINGFWKSQGRGATADNTLTKLVKEGQLRAHPAWRGYPRQQIRRRMISIDSRAGRSRRSVWNAETLLSRRSIRWN